jgi:hypothetical protein
MSSEVLTEDLLMDGDQFADDVLPEDFGESLPDGARSDGHGASPSRAMAMN